MIGWVRDYLNKEFSSSTRMGEDGVAWCREAKSWMSSFLNSLGATKIEYTRGHYEWSMFALINNRWWHFCSGDCRVKLDSLMVRTARDNHDFTGGRNQFVLYGENFEEELRNILCS